MQHRSSLQDTEEGLHRWQVQGDSPTALEEQVILSLSFALSDSSLYLTQTFVL